MTVVSSREYVNELNMRKITEQGGWHLEGFNEWQLPLFCRSVVIYLSDH